MSLFVRQVMIGLDFTQNAILKMALSQCVLGLVFVLFSAIVATYAVSDILVYSRIIGNHSVHSYNPLSSGSHAFTERY